MAGLIVACDALVEWCRRPDRQGLSQRDGMRHRQDLRQRIAEGSRDRAVDEDPRRSLVLARPHLRRQRARVPRPLHLRRGRRNARHGVLQVAGQASRRAILRADRQGAARSRHQEAEHGEPGTRLGTEGSDWLLTASGTWARWSAGQAGRPCRRCPRRCESTPSSPPNGWAAAGWKSAARCAAISSAWPIVSAACPSCRNACRTRSRSSARRCTPPRSQEETVRVAADVVCQDLTRKLTREPASDRYYRTVTKLGQAIANGEFKSIAGLPEAEIMMPYKQD